VKVQAGFWPNNMNTFCLICATITACVVGGFFSVIAYNVIDFNMLETEEFNQSAHDYLFLWTIGFFALGFLVVFLPWLAVLNCCRDQNAIRRVIVTSVRSHRNQ
jgi:branched-subunit amino acid permease